MESASPNLNDSSDINILSANDSGSSKAKKTSDSPMLVEVVHVNPSKLSNIHVIHKMKKSLIKKTRKRKLWTSSTKEVVARKSKIGTRLKFIRGSPHSHFAGSKKGKLVKMIRIKMIIYVIRITIKIMTAPFQNHLWYHLLRTNSLLVTLHQV